MLKTLLSCTALFLFAATNTFSQTIYKLEKWGKIPEEDLKMTHCPFDSGASSMMLQEVGNGEVTFDNEGTIVLFNYWARIKIFDESALDEGNLLIPYYSDREREQFRDLDVQLVLPNGERQKVKSDNIFTTTLTRNLSAKKVFIPNLQKGCIIEYRYELKSSNVTELYGTWYFQQSMPVRWSQYKVTIPQYFGYVYLMQAPRKFDLLETKVNAVVGLNGSRYTAAETTYGLSNLPAMKSEPYITTLSDYRAHIGFQLSVISFPGRSAEKFLSSWEELAKKIEGLDNFGGRYTKSGSFDKIWTAFRKEVPESTPRAELPEKVLRFVSSSFKWNEENRCFSEGLDAAFIKKTGSSADLNLSVVALLRKLDFDAVPLLLSTREHGRMYDLYPFFDQFNTVVAFLYEGEGGVLLDATNPFHPAGQMRGQCYNGQGWLVDQKRPNWVEIKAPEYSETWFGNTTISPEGEISGHFSISMGGPAASRWRSKLDGAMETEVLKKNFAASFADCSFDSVEVKDRAAFDKPVKIDFHCKIPNAATVVNDFLYVRPILDYYVMENPLKSPKRDFPVSFTYPAKSQYVLNFEIPKGYVVEDLPKPARIVLPNDAGKVQFSCGKTDDTHLQIVLKMSLTQLEFQPVEYEALRQFFELMTEKAQFQLVLKKA